MPNKRAENKRKVGAWLDEELAAEFEIAATIKGDHMSDALKQMIRKYVEETTPQNEETSKTDTVGSGPEPLRAVRKKGKK